MEASLERWTTAARSSLQEVASSMLGALDCELAGSSQVLPDRLSGALVPIVDGHTAVQLGLLADYSNIQALVRVMLYMGADEEVDKADVIDAASELANILAGLVKRKLSTSGSRIGLGLPVFIEGSIASSGDVRFQVLEMRIGGISTKLIVLHAGPDRFEELD